MKGPLSLGLGLHASAAAAAAASAPAIAPEAPTIAHFFGYAFEVGPMIAGLCACAAVRFYVAAIEPEHRWSVEVPVTAIAMLVTAAQIISAKPEPLAAIMYGTGLGAAGALIIRIALGWVKRGGGFLEPPGEPRRTITPREGDRDAIDGAMRDLDKIERP